VFKLKTGPQFNVDAGKFCHALSAENQAEAVSNSVSIAAFKEAN
jgi:hypothetical protein